MKHVVLSKIIFLFAAVAVLPNARSEESTTEIKFSDPTKPGTMRISLTRGEVRVRGNDSPAITVKSDVKAPQSKTRKDGLRELVGSSTFLLTEKDNVITLDATGDGGRNSPNFNVTVPRSTSLVISDALGGEISCVDVSGDLEIKNMNGRIKLEGVAGGVLVETINGEVSADVRELHDGKPLSFTSMNGEITIRLPADAKANVRLRSQNGSFLTDFDEKVLVTKTESLARDRNNLSSTGTTRSTRNSSSDLNEEIQTKIREAARAGVDAARDAASVMRETATAVKDAFQEARENSDGRPARPALPPRPPLPPMTGGKIVTGTLNQGGPEIQAATMNGDVKLLKVRSK